jgi:hypothetical protein
MVIEPENPSGRLRRDSSPLRVAAELIFFVVLDWKTDYVKPKQ